MLEFIHYGVFVLSVAYVTKHLMLVSVAPFGIKDKEVILPSGGSRPFNWLDYGRLRLGWLERANTHLEIPIESYVVRQNPYPALSNCPYCIAFWVQFGVYGLAIIIQPVALPVPFLWTILATPFLVGLLIAKVV